MARKLEIGLLSLLLLLGFSLRLYKINAPLADHHSWRQADTASVARNFYRDGWNFFKPQIDNFVPLDGRNENTERLFMTEAPVYNSLVALVYHAFGENEAYARGVTIFFSLLAGLALYLLVKLISGPIPALASFGFFMLAPFNVFYSRVIMPESLIQFLFTSALLAFYQYTRTDRWFWFGLSLGMTMISLTQKSFPSFLVLVYMAMLWRSQGINGFKLPKNWLFAFLAVIPLIGWRWWVAHFPTGTPDYVWLFNSDNIRYSGAFLYWIFQDRLANLILGSWAVSLLVIGLLKKWTRTETLIYGAWVLATNLYFFVLASGNVTHDYYQVVAVPIISILVGLGITAVITNRTVGRKKFWFNQLTLLGVILLSFAFSFYRVRTFYNLQGGADTAGYAVRDLTHPGELVITGDTNDSTLLYNTGRHGWTIGYASFYGNTPQMIDHLIERGASIYVTTKWPDYQDTSLGNYLKNYPILKQTDQYIIFRLQDYPIKAHSK